MPYSLKIVAHDNYITTQELEEEGVDVNDREAVWEYGSKRAWELVDVEVEIIEETPPVKTLTVEIAKEFPTDKDSHDLREFTRIDDAAAESLSKLEGRLNLDGLTELSDAAAESLSKHKGKINCEDPKEWAEKFKSE